PWAAVCVVYMVDENTGQTYTAVNSTTGWRMAYDALTESVTIKRMLHGGARMLPIVNLESRPFKTSFGDRKRPHLQIVGWKSTGGGAPPLPPTPAPAPLPAPASAAPAPKGAKEALDAFTPAAPESHPAAAAANLTDPPKAVTTEEYFDDSI